MIERIGTTRVVINNWIDISVQEQLWGHLYIELRKRNEERETVMKRILKTDKILLITYLLLSK